ncbi:MAG: RsmE family RNA methyltransferase [Actinomycetota bacterium]|nr:RsmE family RNA methyltransferase [Actinomycetota bacterium]
MSPVPGMTSLAESGVAHVVVEDLHRAELTEEDQHHLGAVRRLRTGDAITLGDGQGRWRVALLRETGRSRGKACIQIDFSGEIFQETRQEPPIVVGFCLPSLDRAGWALQKMTELGVDQIHLLYSKFSSVRKSGLETDGNDLKKLARVIREAGMQSRSPFLPTLFPIESLESFVEMYPGCGVCTQGGTDALELGVPTVVGPEGGFIHSELELFSRRFGLGRNILRSETAAVVVSGILSVRRLGLLL